MRSVALPVRRPYRCASETIADVLPSTHYLTTLVTNHRGEFYRCLTEKFLTFALGRGTEYYDIETVDQIVKKLDQEDGRFSALLMGVIESAPFQKQRNAATLAAVEKPGTVETQIARTKERP